MQKFQYCFKLLDGEWEIIIAWFHAHMQWTRMAFVPTEMFFSLVYSHTWSTMPINHSKINCQWIIYKGHSMNTCGFQLHFDVITYHLYDFEQVN